MQSKIQEPRRRVFASLHAAAIDLVRHAVRERDPLGTRDISGKTFIQGSYLSRKDTGQAFYYLWLAGELMTHIRRGNERIYDLSRNIAPLHLQHVASAQEADVFFALEAFQQLNLVSLRGLADEARALPKIVQS